MQLYTVYQCNH